MQLRTDAIVSALAIAGCATVPSPPDPTTQQPSTVESKRPEIGGLGVPLGTVVEIRATIVAGSETSNKQYTGRYLLRVSEVDGQPLPQPQLLEFYVPGFVRVKAK